MKQDQLLNYENLMKLEQKRDSRKRYELIEKMNREMEKLIKEGYSLLNLDSDSGEDFDTAIQIFEKVCIYGYDGENPYNRLAIIYRKQKRYDDEIRILNRWLYVLENIVFPERADRLPKIEKCKTRLERVHELKGKTSLSKTTTAQLSITQKSLSSRVKEFFRFK
ncbi:hypothetical protein ABE354_20435 [Brevibacillus laterosporus]|uniref:hypothetical protein n=1 Tax=Brevibacillus laterosporus TaxID=1465 RepID=UPI003D1E299F